MGCNQGKMVSHPFKDPVGQPIDPLHMPGDVIKNIQNDPHIQFYKNKIQSVLIPLNHQKKKLKNTKQIQKFATADKRQHKEYVESINTALKQNTATATNILSFMINEIADIREKQTVQNKFVDHQEQYAALKCFIYLYTGNYSYKKINQKLRKSDYQNINKIIGAVKAQLEKYNKQKFARKLKANLVHGKILNLYRGIPKPDKKMIKGKQMYWKAFTSTSLQRRVANKFGKFSYIIQLNTNSPHDYMIVPAQLSQFDEEQVILFPYFHFECVQMQDFGNCANYSIDKFNKHKGDTKLGQILILIKCHRGLNRLNIVHAVLIIVCFCLKLSSRLIPY